MAVVPNDIALTQAEALAEAPPKTPAREKKAKPAAAKAKAPEAKVVAPVETQQSAANDSTAAAPAAVAATASPTPGKKFPKGERTGPIWFVERNERNLRERATQSHVFMTKKLTLNTYHAQNILERTVDIWSDAMITLSETMRLFKAEEHCVIVDREVDRHIDECFSGITANLTRLTKMAETNGLDMDEVEVEYQAPTTQSLKVRSPREMRFHTLVLELDKLCMLIDKLWMFKLLSDRHRSQIPYETKRHIIRMVNRVRTLVFRAQASNVRAAAAATEAKGRTQEGVTTAEPASGNDPQPTKAGQTELAEPVAA